MTFLEAKWTDIDPQIFFEVQNIDITLDCTNVHLPAVKDDLGWTLNVWNYLGV